MIYFTPSTPEVNELTIKYDYVLLKSQETLTKENLMLGGFPLFWIEHKTREKTHVSAKLVHFFGKFL